MGDFEEIKAGKVDFNLDNADETMKDVLGISHVDIDGVLQAIKDERSIQSNKFGSNQSGSMRLMGYVPMEVYMLFERKYKGFWKNPINRENFFRRFPHFRTCDTI